MDDATLNTYTTMAKAKDYTKNQTKQARQAIDDAIKRTQTSKYITQERRDILEYNAITLVDAQFDGQSLIDAYDRAYTAAINTINGWKFDFLREDEQAKNKSEPSATSDVPKNSEVTSEPLEDKPNNKNMLIIGVVVAVIIIGVCMFFMTKKK